MELVRFPSRGGFSVRSVFTFALTVVITALLWATFSSAPAHAAPEATWRGTDTLLFDNHGYTKADDFNDPTGTIPDGATVYKSPIQPATSGSPDQKVLVLFFSPGVDPPTADSATFVTFTYKNGELTNPQGQQSVAVAPPDTSGNSGSSCAVEGIGWIVCPVSTFLADAMDSMFSVLATFIEAKPLVLGDTSNSMYLAWDTMRTIANIAFVIAFLVIIYSQLTNIGVSNYGLKKLIPRLIVAAVLVNVSFYISALAIDLSNILGYSVQDIFNVIREQTFHLTNDNLSGFNTNIWGQVTAAVLAGGGLVGGFYYMAAGGPYLLVSLLIGLLLTLLFVVLILAARQAIIVILVIISPLAFVANLLPNTEKLFEKWKDLFITMLVFFPAFSLVFGGSQLAGEIIIQNAGDNIIMLIFGLAVQVAPLVITPLILKLSGTLLGRIAQIANNPRKGLMDRSRNWGERRAEHAKQQNIARGARLKNPSSWGAGMVRGMDYRRRRLSDKTDIWKQEATNRYEETDKFGTIHARKAESDLNKERVHNQHAEHIEHLKSTKGTPLHDASMAVQVSKDSLEARQQETTAYYTQQRTNRATQLGMAAERLEAAKLNTDGWQGNYTAHVESMKLSNTTPVGDAARFAQSSKEHAEAAETRVQAMFNISRSTAGTSLHNSSLNLEGAKLEAEVAKSTFGQHLNAEKSSINGALHLGAVEAETAKLTSQVGETRFKSVIEEYKAGHTPTTATPQLTNAINTINAERQALSIESYRTDNATKVQNDHLAEALIKDSALRDLAGGINERGADAAMARSINTVRTAYAQSVSEANQIIKHFNLKSSERQALALGDTVTVSREDGTSHTFTADDTFAREAVIETQVAVGTIDQVEALVEASGEGQPLFEFRTTIADALAKNSLGGKSLYLGGKTIDDVGWGRVQGRDTLRSIVMETIGKGKIAEKDLANIDPIAVGRILEAARDIRTGNIPAGTQIEANELLRRVDQLSMIARNTLTGIESANVKGKSVAYIEELGQITDPGFQAPS